MDWFRIVPFIALHGICLGVFWVGWSPIAVWFAVSLYLIRMFAITGFYHRYFTHKSFKTNRFWQFIFELVGNSSVQRGPIWWASHHRHHHRFADTEQDVHSPRQNGFWWSHIGWLSSPANFPTRKEYVREWRRRFFTNLAKVRALGFSDTFIRMWEYYLCYCEGGFAERYIGDVQMLFVKPLCRRGTLLTGQI